MKIRVALAALLLASCGSAEQEPDITISGGWARATVPGQSGTAAYFTLVNSGGPDRLMAVSSPAAEASLHSTSLADGVARMRPLPAIDVPAGSEVELRPGGDHVMLMGLGQPLAEGSSLPLELRFERSGDLQVDLPVRTGGEAQ